MTRQPKYNNCKAEVANLHVLAAYKHIRRLSILHVQLNRWLRGAVKTTGIHTFNGTENDIIDKYSSHITNVTADYTVLSYLV